MARFFSVRTRVVCFAATLVLVSCGPVDAPVKDSGMTNTDSGTAAFDAGAGFDAGSTFDAGSMVDSGVVDAGTDAGISTFHIEFNYQFDTKGMFTNPERRAALAAAAKVWETLLRDEYEDIPERTQLRIRHPEQPYDAGFYFTLNQPIDDLVIFVGSATLPSGVAATSSPSAALATITDATLRARLSERFDGNVFQPWTGWISFSDSGRFFFDPTPETGDDIPLDKTDFISTATHEIGHVLGFGTAAGFKRHIVAGAFTGPKAVALYGAPVPTSSDGSHVSGAVMFNGQSVLMDNAVSASGVRRFPTALDNALLEDTGHQFWP